MKIKLQFYITCFFFFLSLSCFTQEIRVHRPETTILLFHPTVRNVQTILSLSDSGIFPVPEDFHIIGVYHKNSAYNYSQTTVLLEEKKICNVSLVEISDTLYPENIFKPNSAGKIFTKLFEQSAGAIFFGGPDIPPVCYGEKTNLLTEISDPYRHYLELSFIFYMLGGYQFENFTPLLYNRPNYAILGICLGMQSINIATGGTLVQDIPTEIYHTFTSEEVLLLNPDLRHRNYFVHNDPDPLLLQGHFHQLKYANGSVLANINSPFGHSPYIWSSHHQCIRNTGKHICTVAFSTDSLIIEAIQHDFFPNVLGVQFHPEINAIFNDSIKLKLTPKQSELKSYSEMFPDSLGSNFHKNFWKYISDMFFPAIYKNKIPPYR